MQEKHYIKDFSKEFVQVELSKLELLVLSAMLCRVADDMLDNGRISEERFLSLMETCGLAVECVEYKDVYSDEQSNDIAMKIAEKVNLINLNALQIRH